MRPNGMGGSPRSGGLPRPGRSRSSSVRGSGVSHGLRWAGIRSASAARRICPTRTVRSPPWSDRASSDRASSSRSGPAGRRACGRPRSAQATAAHPRAGLRGRAGPAPADPPGLKRHQGGVAEPDVAAPRGSTGDLRGVRARRSRRRSRRRRSSAARSAGWCWPGCPRRPRRRDAGWPGSGACPSERPRCAMPTRPVTKSGRSRASEANSSITIISRGRGAWPGLAPGPFGVFLDVLGPGGGQDPLPPRQLGGQRGQGPLGQVRVQVGDHPGHVRQVHAVLERAAALVVHQHERHLVRPVHARPATRSGSAAARTCPPRWCPRSARAGRPCSSRCRTARRSTPRSPRGWTGRPPATRPRSPRRRVVRRRGCRAAGSCRAARRHPRRR